MEFNNEIINQNNEDIINPIIYFNQFSKGYIVSSQGRRKTMEDFYLIEVYKSIIIYGIFDGHSGDFISSKLPILIKDSLIKKLEIIKNDKNKIISTINDFFIDIDKIFYNEWKLNKFLDDGSTANIIICIDKDIYFVNLGDSRSLFFNNDKIIFSTQDHKPDNPNEQFRILKSGNTVIKRGEYYRINGSLAVSRSFGDFVYKTTNNKYDGINSSVSIIPNITVINIPKSKRNKPRYIIIASDGLWDVFSNIEIKNYINKSLKKGETTKSILTNLIKMAWSRNSHDNISIILIYI